MSILDKRLLVLAGKGGVGRTTVAASLARAAAGRGKRVLIAQTNAPERLGRMLGMKRPIGPTVSPIDDGLFAVNMTPKQSLHEYGIMLLRYEPIYRAVFENKAMRSFLGAFPGLDYWSMLGKAWWHTTEHESGRAKYDLVILDGPASGHAAAMLRIPDSVHSAMPKGPLARDAAQAAATLRDDKQSAVVLVTLPEELPARETSTLAADIRELRMPLGPLIVNAMPPAEAADPSLDPVLPLAARPFLPACLDTLLSAVSVVAARRRDADRIVDVLRSDPALPILHLPRLPSNDLGPTEIAQLAAILAQSLAP